MKILGIDVGGSFIKAGIVENRTIKWNATIKTNKKEVVKQIEEIIREAKKKHKVKRIGIGFPGQINTVRGKILNAPNLGLKNFALRQELEKKLRVAVKIENDANCFALAESKIGKARSLENFVVLTIGTGIGSGLVLCGKLYRGGKRNEGIASEIGHMILDVSGPRCSCGNRGCLETFASGKAIAREAKKAFGREMLVVELEKLARRSGNAKKKAESILKKAGYYLGLGLTNIANILNPEAIILAGGAVSEINETGIFFQAAKKTFTSKALRPANRARLWISRLKHAGIHGAALLWS